MGGRLGVAKDGGADRTEAAHRRRATVVPPGGEAGLRDADEDAQRSDRNEGESKDPPHMYVIGRNGVALHGQRGLGGAWVGRATRGSNVRARPSSASRAPARRGPSRSTSAGAAR